MLTYVPPFIPHPSRLPSQSSILPRSTCPARPRLVPIRRLLVARVRRGHKPEPNIRETLHEVAPMKNIDFQLVDFSSFKGKVVFAVNVASNDRLTDPVYKFLAEMLDKYQDGGFEVLAFPCNWFGQKETALNEDIKKFVFENYTDRITLMDKFNIEWNEVFALAQKHFPGEIIWNFHGKFLFDRHGKPVGRFDLLSENEFIEDSIQKALQGIAQQPVPDQGDNDVTPMQDENQPEQAEEIEEIEKEIEMDPSMATSE